MPFYTSHPHKRDLPALIAAARPFLRGELQSIDPELPSLIAVLRSVGAGECYHKHGTFLAHLVDVYRILKLWCAPDAVARCGLFHSSYSNSYVNLAIFDPHTTREHVQDLIGTQAERLVHLFCVVPRHALIHDDLLFHYTDEELIEHLALSEISLRNKVFDVDQPWRMKLQSLLPAEGIKLKHIRTGEAVAVSRRVMAIFILMTIADFSDQYVDYQDKLFDNENGRLEFGGNNWKTLWPGCGKPGLWMNSLSRLGALYTLIVREEEIYMEEQKQRGEGDSNVARDEDIELVVPPVFDNCTKVLDAKEQIVARELYWEAICSDGSKDGEWKRVEAMLLESIEKNPFVGEPHLVLAQVYLNQGRYEETEEEAGKGLELILEWGSSWDKRMTWEGWVSWGRVMLAKAKEKSWPQDAWGIINLGLVR
ncbi:uncharacterized protein [Typha latifolia]|uniref:uncharacterized protein n=1 Tax=Typha latifolia TaxID=4733 RepID=UPI003C2C5739